MHSEDAGGCPLHPPPPPRAVEGVLRIPAERTIVFAGGRASDLTYLEKVGVDALMISFDSVKGSKNFQMRLREGFSWKPITYLDSGVFTFMRRAGVTVQNKSKKTAKPATFAEFRAFAKEYIDYLKTDAHLWDWIIDLDCAEIFGVEAEDAFRRGLKQIVGGRLLPVWHAQRGRDGWTKMIEEYPYVCIALGKGVGGRSAKNAPQIREMIREAHVRGTRVHMLGVSTLEYFETYEADTMDSSSWASGVRWGEIKLNRGKVMIPKFAQSQRRPLEHAKLEHLAHLVKKWGFTIHPELNAMFGIEVDETDKSLHEDYWGKMEVGIRMLMLRQDMLRGGLEDVSGTLEEVG